MQSFTFKLAGSHSKRISGWWHSSTSTIRLELLILFFLSSVGYSSMLGLTDLKSRWLILVMMRRLSDRAQFLPALYFLINT